MKFNKFMAIEINKLKFKNLNMSLHVCFLTIFSAGLGIPHYIYFTKTKIKTLHTSNETTDCLNCHYINQFIIRHSKFTHLETKIII